MFMTRERLSVLHIAKAQLHLGEEEYRHALQTFGGVESGKDLSQEGFNTVMEEFARRGFVSSSRRSAFGRRNFRMPTPAQIVYVRKLWNLVTDGLGTPEGLDKWIAGRFGVSALRFVDAATIRKVIGALQGWCKKRGIDVRAA